MIVVRSEFFKKKITTYECAEYTSSCYKWILQRSEMEESCISIYLTNIVLFDFF